MEKLKSNLQNMVLVLVGVALVCGGLLAYVNQLTKPAIEKQAEQTLADGIKSVLAAEEVTVNGTNTVTRNVNGKEASFIIYSTDKGVAVQSVDPNGFGGNLKVLVGFDSEGTILGYTLLEHAETPGLGAKAADWFQKPENGGNGGNSCVIGKNPGSCNLTVSKDGGDIDAITASTITSRAFLSAVREAYNTFKAGSTPQADSNAAESCGENSNNED